MSLTASVARQVTGPVTRSPLEAGVGDGLTAAVKALFASGEPGGAWDWWRGVNYQDSARTTLVTASGERLGSVTDISPNGKHASSTGNSRPIWNSAGYGTWDAFDDYMQTAAIDFSATDAVTVVASVRKLSDASTAIICELSAAASINNGAFYLLGPASTASTYTYLSRGTASVSVSGSNFAAPITSVVTGQSDISAPSCALRVNATLIEGSASSQGTGNFGNYTFNIGARNTSSLFFNGRIYRLLVIGRALTSTERSLAERWAAQPAGVTLA